MIEAILNVVDKTLGIVNMTLQRKYKKKWMDLRHQLREEQNKTHDEIDHAKLWNIQQEMADLATAFANDIGLRDSNNNP